MGLNDCLVIAAIIIGPILAIQVQKFIENKKEKKEWKLKIFKTLMATRATPLSPSHIEALNRIDIEFYDDEKVKEAWKLLLDNFANYPQDPKAPDYQTKLNSCAEKSNELLTDLLYEMARSIGYKFDKVHIKRGAYIPQGHANIELEQNFIRNSLVRVFLGEIPIPIKVITNDEMKK